MCQKPFAEEEKGVKIRREKTSGLNLSKGEKPTPINTSINSDWFILIPEFSLQPPDRLKKGVCCFFICVFFLNSLLTQPVLALTTNPKYIFKKNTDTNKFAKLLRLLFIEKPLYISVPQEQHRPKP